MVERKKVLEPWQSKKITDLMLIEGMTRGQARYAVLTDEQKVQFKQQVRDNDFWQRLVNHKRAMLFAKRADAKRRGIEFELTEDNVDWPALCPVTGIKLRYDGANVRGRRGPSDDTAVFDRIDNMRGYLPENVVIVSHWVNLRKGDATVDQLRKIADFYEGLAAERRAKELEEIED